MVRMNFILPFKMAISHQVLSLGVIQSTWQQYKRQNEKNITELHESEGNKKIKLKKNLFYFFSNFQKIGSGGSVK